jgi:hypothetical protein
MTRAILLWIVFAASYLLFAGQASETELVALLPTATAVTAFALLCRATQDRRLDLRAPWPRVIARSLISVPADSVRVGLMLARVLTKRPKTAVGTLSVQPFCHGENRPSPAARRALVALGASLAPNGYMVAIPDGQDRMIMHRLVAAEQRDDHEWPV